MKTLINKANPEIRITAPDGIVKNRTNCWAIWSEGNRLMLLDKDNWTLVEEEQKEPHYTKRNALFDKCVENCDPVVMKNVSDEIDEMLEKEQKTKRKQSPALKKIVDNLSEEKLAKTRAEMKTVETEPVDLEKAAEEYADKHGFRVPYDGSDKYYDDVDVKASLEGFKAGAKWMAEQIKGGSK